MNEFIKQALEAGFTQEQIDFMEGYLAKLPHTHEISDIDELEETLADLEGEEEGEGND